MTVRTLADLLFHVREAAAGRGELLSVCLPRGREALSTSDFVSNVHSLALALEDLGVKAGDRVAIFSENRPEWPTVDFACQLLGAPTVPLFPTLPADRVGYVLRNSGSRLVFYSDAAKRDLLAELQDALTTPVEGVAFDADAAPAGGGAAGPGTTLTRLIGRGAARRGEMPLSRFRDRVAEDDLASIIYTSGTTGDPKGVMLSHRNLVSNFLACGELFKLGPADLALSFLPLSHVFQRTIDHLCFYRGVSVHYVTREAEVARELAAARPTILTSVPLLYERLYVRMTEELARQGPLRRLAGRWAVAVGRRHAAERRHGFVGPLLALERQLAERLAFRKLRALLGGRLRLPISGGAPLAREVGDFFEAIGMPVFQGYGLTEASPVLAVNAPRQTRQGSVGRLLPDVELRLAADGEILVKGPGVMRGYWENPEATRESVDEDGWLHTGDLGLLDRSGYLFITDRKKDILVTAGGRKIAPQPIESLLTGHPLISQAVVVGDNFPYPAVLVVPDFQRLAAALGEPLAPEELVEHPESRRRIAAVLADLSGGLAEADRLRRFKLLARPFTREAGELTPTFNVRRKVIALRYAAEIAALYQRPPA
jgi:long-chain acyl-CoA synthetase